MRTHHWTLTEAVAHSAISGRRLSTTARLAGLATCALLISGSALLAGQTPAASTAPQPAPVHHHKHSPAKPMPQPDPPPLAVVAPPEPEKPKWPANDPPAQAAVVWDSHGLRIDATNSSLQQILKDVSTATGAKVEGLANDERVFGAYGPGQARDVLSQLLQGSAYNVIMIGDQGQGTPREILLSVRQAGPAQPQARNTPVNNTNDEDNEPEEPTQPEQPAPRPGFQPGNAPRALQDMQQRQQQLQQQQQQQPGQPQQPPPQ
jgi:hypothetical protein